MEPTLVKITKGTVTYSKEPCMLHELSFSSGF